MLFNSFIFWGFFAVVLGVYRFLPHRAQNVWLLLAGYVFYGYWDWRFLSLLIISSCADFALGNLIARTEEQSRRKSMLVLSITLNLVFLGFFKYFGFFVESMNQLLMDIGINSALPVLHIVLPVGISFYTFQSMSYTIDVYRREMQPAPTLLGYATYVSFFPQLLAGPIERPNRLLPQVLNPRVITRSLVAEGVYLCVYGLFKKVVIADNMAVIANHVFGRDPSTLTATEVLVGIYAFAFQIYGDFSGYSSIAKGLANFLGFDLMWNFRMPYLARSPSEFWQRWHISLSTWLRDYLYISLGGNRGGEWFTYRNLMLTMLLGGLWHGAAWTFVWWGAFHGAILIAYRMASGRGGSAVATGPVTLTAGNVAKIFLMFHLVCISWLLFRADSMHQAGAMLAQLFVNHQASPFGGFAFAMMAFLVLPMFLYEYWLERRGDQLALLHTRVAVQTPALAYFLMMLMVFPPMQAQTFIYFQF